VQERSGEVPCSPNTKPHLIALYKSFLHRFAFVLKWFEVSSGEPSNLERCREERCSRGQERCRRGAGEVRRGAGIFICYKKMAGVKVALSWYKTPT